MPIYYAIECWKNGARKLWSENFPTAKTAKDAARLWIKEYRVGVQVIIYREISKPGVIGADWQVFSFCRPDALGNPVFSAA